MHYFHTDIPELRGYDSGIVLNNLARLQDRQSRLNEAVLAQLWELAGAILRDSGGDPEVTDSILLSLQDGGEGPGTAGDAGSRLFPGDRELADRIGGHAGLYGRLVLYRFLREQQGAGPSSSGPRPLPEARPSARGRISYMKSVLADKAYLRFSGLMPDCRFSEAHSFVDACEDVFNGLCQFCLLPLEVVGEGRLTAFSRLIVTYDLTIAAACDLTTPTPEGSRVTRFGLLCRETGGSCLLPFFPGTEVRYVELLHTTPVSPSLTDLLTAAEFCGLYPVRADTLPVDGLTASADGRDSGESERPAVPPVSLVLEASADADIGTFARFLELEASEDVLMGAYGVI